MREWMVWLTAVALLGAGEIDSKRVDEGVRLFRAKKFDRSYELLLPAAKAGDARAEFYLGLLYDMGSIGMMDKARAVEWYRKAAEQGYADAQYDMGVMFSKGEGIYKDLEEARHWYEKAAAQGHGYAFYNLGVVWERGYGVSPDWTRAESYYEKAVAQGVAKAAYNLANHYYKGGDLKKAFEYYRRAAELGHTGARFHLGWLYAHGEGVEQNLSLAKKWYREAALNGSRQGALNYGLMLKDQGDPEADYWIERGQRWKENSK